MKNKNKIKLGLSLVGIGLSLGLYINNQCFLAKEEKITLRSEKINSPIRITQISDLHSNAIKNLDELLVNIKSFDPHFIILTGDMIDYGTDSKIERTLYFLKNLSKLKICLLYTSPSPRDRG